MLSFERSSSILLTVLQSANKQMNSLVLGKKSTYNKYVNKNKGESLTYLTLLERPGVGLNGGPHVIPPHNHVVVLVLLRIVEILDQVVILISDGEVIPSVLWIVGLKINTEHVVHHHRDVVHLGQFNYRA